VGPQLLLLIVSSLLQAHPLAAQDQPKKLSLQELEQRVNADSNDALAHLELGQALLDKRRFDRAEREFRVAVAIAPDLAEAYLGLAALPHVRGDSYWRKREKQSGLESVQAAWQEAGKFYRLAFLLDPLVDPRLAPRIEERATLEVDGTSQFVWWMLPLTKAMNAFKAGKFKEAKERCEKLLQDAKSPEGEGLPYDVLWFHGLAAAHLDNFQTAATDFTLLTTRALRDAELVPDASPLLANDYRYMNALMLLYTGQRDLAVQLLQEALTQDPSLYMAHSQLATIHERSGRLDQAVLERQLAVDANPENGSLLVDLGLTLQRHGKLEEASRAFEQAAVLNPRDPRASYQLGMIAFQLGRKDVARGQLERFLILAPSRMKAQADEARQRLASLGP
jgi:Tfp pilus assembly protein PilF